MKLKKGLRTVILLVSIVALGSINGCSFLNRKEIRLYPIEKMDIFGIPKGATVMIPEGTKSINSETNEVIHTWEQTEIPVEKQGWFVSDFWLEEVGEVKAGR